MFANIRRLAAPLIGAFFLQKMMTQTPLATSKKVALTITLPSINLSVLKNKGVIFLSNIYRPLSGNFSKATSQVSSRARRLKMPSLKDKFNFDKKIMKFVFPAILGVVVIAGIITIVRSLPDAQSRPVNESSKLSEQNALATIHLDKKFDFPLRDDKGKEAGTFEYVLQSAELQNQIIVKGQRASAVTGRVFLILNLKITNSLEQTIQLNTRDYLRLIVKSNTNEQLAPDIHNDPVEVQAISTKYTRVGIALTEEDARKLIQLKVGEINGEKNNIDLNFKF